MEPALPGADAVVAWFGEWPSFHDAEVLSVHVNRGARSQIRLYTFLTSGRTDSAGRFTREREAIVVFEFQEIVSLRLDGENADGQNVIAGVIVEEADRGWRLHLSPSFGLSGEIVAAQMSVRLERPS
jgi:hypothetical protein